MYYLFGGRSWASNPARLISAGTINKHGLWWDDGRAFDNPPSSPVTVILQPFDSHNPDMSREMPEVYQVKVPIYCDKLVSALKSAGVNNLELYDVEITDPDNGQIYRNYKAVNVIGLVAAIDVDKLGTNLQDDTSPVDESIETLVNDNKTNNMLFFRLAENNGAILIHKTVRDHLIKQGFTNLEFYNLKEAAI